MRTSSARCGLAFIGLTLLAAAHAAARPPIEPDADALPVMGPCCLPDGSCEMMYCHDCIEHAGLWHGPGIDCDSVNCKPCPADFNGDELIDPSDLELFIKCFEADACPQGHDADLNNDGRVNDTDLDLFLDALESGKCV